MGLGSDNEARTETSGSSNSQMFFGDTDVIPSLKELSVTSYFKNKIFPANYSEITPEEYKELLEFLEQVDITGILSSSIEITWIYDQNFLEEVRSQPDIKLKRCHDSRDMFQRKIAPGKRHYYLHRDKPNFSSFIEILDEPSTNRKVKSVTFSLTSYHQHIVVERSSGFSFFGKYDIKSSILYKLLSGNDLYEYLHLPSRETHDEYFNLLSRRTYANLVFNSILENSCLCPNSEYWWYWFKYPERIDKFMTDGEKVNAMIQFIIDNKLMTTENMINKIRISNIDTKIKDQLLSFVMHKKNMMYNPLPNSAIISKN